MKLLLTAVQFYSRIPVPRWVGHSDAQLAAATPYFPVVGMLIGLVTGLVFEFARMAFGPPIASVLALAIGLLLTGGFHEDGFADVCDGFGGGYSKARVLEIMQDSRVGAFAAMGISLLLLLQAVCMAEAAPRFGAGLLELVAAHAASRALALCVAWRLPYVRLGESKAKPVVSGLRAVPVAAALLLGLLPLVVYGWLYVPTQPLLALALAALGVLVCAARFVKKLGGYTGDCLGAAQQVAFTALLLGFAYRG